LSGRTRNILIVVGALLVGYLSTLFLNPGPPVVSVAPKTLFYIGSFPFTNSLLMTFVADIIVIGVAIAATRNMQLVPRGLQNFMEMVIEFLYGIFRNVNEKFVARAFPLCATIFLFVITSNYLGLLPSGEFGPCKAHSAEAARVAVNTENSPLGAGIFGAPLAAEGYTTCPAGTEITPFIRSPSADLNFALALGLISFVFFEYWGFRTLGIGYLKKFFNLNGIMSFVGIMEFISEIIKPIALAFRLFGNIFAGEVLILVLSFLVPLVVPMPFYAFELFVGFIQAVVFSLLTMAFLSIAVTSHEEEHHEGHAGEAARAH